MDERFGCHTFSTGSQKAKKDSEQMIVSEKIAVAAIAVAANFAAGAAQSQQPIGWGGIVDGLAVYQGKADLDDGGDFSASRAFLRTGIINRFADGSFAGLVLSYGQFSYDFGFPGNQPWEDVRDIRISVPLRFALDGGASVLISPQLRWDYERGVSASDGFTYGVFGGISWALSPNLRIGPALGVFSEIGIDDLEVFPAVLVDWTFAERWNLSTGSGLGATQGPGVSLEYAVSDAVKVGMAVRSESIRFQLDDEGLAPDGIGEDSSIPVVLSLQYAPNPGVSFTAFAGAELNGELKLENAAGREVSRQSYDTAPIAGVAFQLRF
ncbi:hypothetical protein [Ruegeria arenilitoris]|uniref:hypothetical protein n=1 Tax=Ruegeria arenilitoris TaxID=1173585 RepID=UPI001C2BCBB9|nr:hypothetical protein [Ruegeria arenilitoris]